MATSQSCEPVEASDVTIRWLADTGASRDMVPISLARLFPNSICRVPLILLHTGNGIVRSDKALSVKFTPLGCVGSARIMKDTPVAYSVGRLNVEQGFGFHWQAKHSPFHVTPQDMFAIFAKFGIVAHTIRTRLFS